MAVLYYLNGLYVGGYDDDGGGWHEMCLDGVIVVCRCVVVAWLVCARRWSSFELGVCTPKLTRLDKPSNYYLAIDGYLYAIIFMCGFI